MRALLSFSPVLYKKQGLYLHEILFATISSSYMLPSILHIVLPGSLEFLSIPGPVHTMDLTKVAGGLVRVPKYFHARALTEYQSLYNTVLTLPELFIRSYMIKGQRVFCSIQFLTVLFHFEYWSTKQLSHNDLLQYLLHLLCFSFSCNWPCPIPDPYFLIHVSTSVSLAKLHPPMSLFSTETCFGIVLLDF